MDVSRSSLPKGYKLWPNRQGADSRTWSCMSLPSGWLCRHKRTGTVLEGVGSLSDLPKVVRRRRSR